MRHRPGIKDQLIFLTYHIGSPSARLLFKSKFMNLRKHRSLPLTPVFEAPDTVNRRNSINLIVDGFLNTNITLALNAVDTFPSLLGP